MLAKEWLGSMFFGKTVTGLSKSLHCPWIPYQYMGNSHLAGAPGSCQKAQGRGSKAVQSWWPKTWLWFGVCWLWQPKQVPVEALDELVLVSKGAPGCCSPLRIPAHQLMALEQFCAFSQCPAGLGRREKLSWEGLHFVLFFILYRAAMTWIEEEEAQDKLAVPSFIGKVLWCILPCPGLPSYLPLKMRAGE